MRGTGSYPKKFMFAFAIPGQGAGTAAWQKNAREKLVTIGGSVVIAAAAMTAGIEAHLLLPLRDGIKNHSIR